MNNDFPYLLMFGVLFIMMTLLLIRVWIKHNPNVHLLYKVKTVLAGMLGVFCVIYEFTR